jgi:hypothetical protein
MLRAQSGWQGSHRSAYFSSCLPADKVHIAIMRLGVIVGCQGSHLPSSIRPPRRVSAGKDHISGSVHWLARITSLGQCIGWQGSHLWVKTLAGKNRIRRSQSPGALVRRRGSVPIRWPSSEGASRLPPRAGQGSRRRLKWSRRPFGGQAAGKELPSAVQPWHCAVQRIFASLSMERTMRPDPPTDARAVLCWFHADRSRTRD